MKHTKKDMVHIRKAFWRGVLIGVIIMSAFTVLTATFSQGKGLQGSMFNFYNWSYTTYDTPVVSTIETNIVDPVGFAGQYGNDDY